jgi:hypothetical protein
MDHILSMNRSFNLVKSKLSFLKFYFIRETYSIDRIEDIKILFFFGYIGFAFPAVRVDLIDDLR